MPKPPSKQSLFRSMWQTNRNAPANLLPSLNAPQIKQPLAKHRDDDFYSRGELEAIRVLLARANARIRARGSVRESLAWGGDIVSEIKRFGLPCL